jgi:hypothetical protein
VSKVKREAGGDRNKTAAPAKTREQSMKAGSGNNRRKLAFTFTDFITMTNQTTFRAQQNDLQGTLSVLAQTEHPVSDHRRKGCLFSDSYN